VSGVRYAFVNASKMMSTTAATALRFAIGSPGTGARNVSGFVPTHVSATGSKTMLGASQG
jgi:hypothetical protein